MLVVLALGSLSTMLTATTVNVALPSIIGAFALGQDEAQWVSSAFLTASTTCMLLNAWAVARFGPRLSFAAAMAAFIAGGALGAGGQTFEIIVLGRALQGAGAGLIQPLAMLLIMRTFPQSQQGLAISLYALSVIASPAFGPVLGGVLADWFDWRIAFVGTAPLAALAMAGGLAFLPARDPHAPRYPLDWPGLLLAACVVTLAVQSLTHGHREGWDDTQTGLRLFGAVACAALFILRCRTAAHPIMQLRVLAAPGFARADVVIAMTGVAVYGSTYLIPLFAQMVQPYTPLAAGQALLPAGVAMAIMFPLAGRWCDAGEPRLPLMIGVPAFGVSMMMFAQISVNTPFVALAGWTALGRVGVALLMPAAHMTAMRLSDPELLPHTAPILTFLTQCGGIAGISGLAVLVQERAAFHAALLAENMSNEAGQADDYLLARTTEIATGAPADLIHAGATQHLAAHLAAAAELLAFRDCFALLAALFALLFVALPLLPRAPQPVTKP